MPKEKALQSFRKPPLRLNCAQAVAHGFDREDLVAKMVSCGRGRAPGGLCGALFCAMQLAGEERAEAVAAEFEKTVGGRHCRFFESEHRAGCEESVAVAVEILEKTLRA